MTAYMIGSLVGRLLASIFIVFFGILLFKKFNMSEAAVAIKRPLSIVSIVCVFLLGLVGGTLAIGIPTT